MEDKTMDFLELAKNRYSERFFDSRPIEQEKLNRILEAGGVVPTACNYQPQHFYVIRSVQGLQTLKQVTHFHYNVPVMILVCHDAREVWHNPGDRYYRNYNSGEQDASIAATTMMYEAEELGVHTIWIRGFDSKTVVDAYGLPKHMIPVMLLGLGYPKEKARANAWHYRRKPIEEFVDEL
jgi:nitroreductase